ncbi:hypothetical protein [Pedobacter cryotolerans]|uniref:DUF4468 domain-containing protein n=1 Tax=Pedobacter cryotolerans TaxID=2571270 RepID=A0A4U1C835_9SPHI|nr:hypothetical protein [Pedobacter cryotolerans]TKC01758.1 hypothetical protein FA045_05760 [Pedobacter cryotolerans]
MKKIVLIALILLIQLYALAQEKLVKDLDFDGKKDTVYIDQKEREIICRLSTQNFKKLMTKPLEMASDNTYIKATHNGFELRNNWMRSGYACQFRYEKMEKRIRLIGITEYAFGNAANDGSGEASANLLTGNYIGNWHYYDHLANNEQCELVKIPTIKAKLKFKKIYLEEFSEETYFGYSAQLEKIVEKHKNAEQKRRSKN